MRLERKLPSCPDKYSVFWVNFEGSLSGDEKKQFARAMEKLKGVIGIFRTE